MLRGPHTRDDTAAGPYAAAVVWNAACPTFDAASPAFVWDLISPAIPAVSRGPQRSLSHVPRSRTSLPKPTPTSTQSSLASVTSPSLRFYTPSIHPLHRGTPSANLGSHLPQQTSLSAPYPSHHASQPSRALRDSTRIRSPPSSVVRD
ncbi:hypothetical protein BD309DRAFT_961470 [Dichomitus squalens]|nr:hypothetical protein BD309DRAFT_961470 [Dichomitus squalens]